MVPLSQALGPTRMRQFTDFVWNHLNWVVALAAFYIAFNGIVRKSMTWSPPPPVGYLWPTQYLSSAHAHFLGYVYLGVGVVALFSEFAGMIGFICACLLAWTIGTFLPQR